ncbi:MAG TPA: Spy/CpxP family protein refolding chaperone [Casimicrobiaceae bacterium]|nr:Spy/CpxP family protein refolding chaperone [Casimicrobiaceae bacterium]
MKSLFRSSFLAAFCALSALAYAQPAPGMGPPLRMLAAVKSQLNLNTSQQLQWDNVAAQAKAAHDAARASHDQLKAAFQAELAKAEPDLASVATLADGARQQTESAHRAVRDAWLALYATFTPDQKAVVRDALQAGMARMAARRHARSGPPATD